MDDDCSLPSHRPAGGVLAMQTATFSASIWSWGPARNALEWAVWESLRVIGHVDGNTHYIHALEATPETHVLREAVQAIKTAQDANDATANTWLTVDLPDLACITDPIRHYVDRVS